MSMEPNIRYVEAADGVSIAYWTMGDGPPFLSMPRRKPTNYG